jgi:FkbM family methyltransferase
MIVDPAEGIGGNLAFIPQLYDVWEREALRTRLPEGGTFVDVGANMGAYSLWAARIVGPRGRVLAYEAAPANYERLVENIALNRFSQVHAFHVGVSDKTETLKLHINPIGNSGGHSFVPGFCPEGSAAEIDVQCEPLAELLARNGLTTVDFMKLDIEGFERRVLSRFFQDVPSGSALRPRHMLAELARVDARGPGSLWETIVSAGYRPVRQGKANALFER